MHAHLLPDPVSRYPSCLSSVNAAHFDLSIDACMMRRQSVALVAAALSLLAVVLVVLLGRRRGPAAVALAIPSTASLAIPSPARTADAASYVPVGPERVVFVSATSSNHFCAAVHALVSAHRHHPRARVVVYDLGVTAAQRRWAARIPFVDMRAFDFRRYPPHFDMARAAGQYAWKPVVVADVMERDADADVVVWMDAGDGLLGALDAYWENVWNAGGMYSGVSAGTVADWTHPGTLDYLGVRPQRNTSSAGDRRDAGAEERQRRRLLSARNCNAAFLILFRALTYTDLVLPWRACALDAACIAPEGSSRANHRQDQAALSVLVHQRADRYRTCTTAVPDPLVNVAYTIHRDNGRAHRQSRCPGET